MFPDFRGRHRVVTAPAERLTAHQAPHSQSRPFDETVSLKRLHRVAGTGGIESAALRQKRRKRLLVEPDEQDQRPCEDAAAGTGSVSGVRRGRFRSHGRAFSSRGAGRGGSGVRTPEGARSVSTSAMTAARPAFFICLRGTRTIRQGSSRGNRSRNDSHRSRLARFRSTARRLYFRLQMTPHLANRPSPGATERARNRPARR